jgi:aminoglycoside/choline kinase family phosphotransferase
LVAGFQLSNLEFMGSYRDKKVVGVFVRFRAPLQLL